MRTTTRLIACATALTLAAACAPAAVAKTEPAAGPTATAAKKGPAGKPTKPSKPDKPRPEKPRERVYQGTGTVLDVDPDSGLVSVAFERVNRNLGRVLGEQREGVVVFISDDTAYDVDGDTLADLVDTCAGDTITVTLRSSKRKVTVDDLQTLGLHVAAVKATSEDCSYDA